MLGVALVVVIVVAAWSVAAVLIALLTGGIIRERDQNDRPYGAAVTPAPAAASRL